MRREWESSKDIQCSEKLSIDWNFQSDNPLGKRAYARLGSGDLTSIFDVRSIQVRVARPVFKVNASLLDVSQGGLAILARKEFFMDLPLSVAFHLSRRKIISRCVVRQVHKTGGNFKVGLEFVDLSKEDSEYIAGLYSSKILNKVGNRKTQWCDT